MSSLGTLEENIQTLIETLESKEKHGALRNELLKLIEKVESIEREKEYYRLLDVVNVLANNVKESLSRDIEDEDWEKVLEPFMRLAEINKKLEEFPSKNLCNYVNGLLSSVGQMVEKKLKKSYSAKLNEIDWPTPMKDTTKPVTEEKLIHLGNSFKNLVRLQEKLHQPSKSKSLANLPRLWVIQILLDPILLRFSYHFRNNTDTNRLDKPEWFYAFVINQIKGHLKFLEFVQGLLEDCGLNEYNAIYEFIRGLVIEVKDKINCDIPHIGKRDDLLWKTINETLVFKKSLQNEYKYPEDFPSPLDVFCTKENFRNWMKLEKSYSQVHLNDILNHKRAWNFHNEESPEQDPHKTSYSGFQMLKTIETMQGRCTLLPSLELKNTFFDRVQMPMIEGYLDEVLSTYNKLIFEALTKYNLKYICILANTLTYCVHALTEWGEQVFYIELNAYRETKKTQEEENINITEENLLNVANKTIFDSIIPDYQQYETMIGTLCTRILSMFRSSSKPYVTKKRIEPLFVAPDIVELSPEICDPLTYLKDILADLELNLATKLFDNVWKSLALSIDEYFFKEVICEYSFSSATALQFQFDMKVLINMFKNYTPKPENYFKKVKESCTILTLPEDTFNPFSLKVEKALKSQRFSNPSIINEFLSKFGIHKLSLELVNLICVKRIIKNS